MAAGKTNQDAAAAQAALLEELKAAALQVGLQVREERLLREVGYRVRSGRCRLRDAEVIFLDRGLPAGAQIDLMAEELAGRSLEALYLSPAARAVIERAAGREAPPDARTHADRG